MTIEISHTQHPTSKTMYIFFNTDKNYDYNIWSFCHPHDNLWSNGAEIPTSAPERTPFVVIRCSRISFYTTDFRCARIKEPRSRIF